jgi:thiamine biosynthesis protein ThiI
MDVIIHLDEIFLKGNNRANFIKKLADNIRRLFKGASARRVEGGLILSGMSENDFNRLADLPGVANFAPVVECPNDIKSIEKALSDWPVDPSAKTFRVSSSRSNKKYELNSEELNREIGRFVENKYQLKVNLKKFDINIHVDVRQKTALLYGQMREGAGGLPTGTAGKVLCLVSGGIDSPVAAYRMMRRGAEVVMVHFQNETRVTDEVSEKIIDLAEALACFQPGIHLLIVPFGDLQRQIVMKIPADYRMLVSRRLMFMIAERLAKKEHCLALVTGDSLGQVASQTLENMNVVYAATGLLKLAPLVGANKCDIMKHARRLGTLDISNRPYQDCCSLFVSKHPKTKAVLADVAALEQELDLSTLDKIEPISYHIGIPL